MQANFVTWAIMAKAWGKVGNVARTREVLEQAKAAGIEPPLAAWASLMAAHGQQGDRVGYALLTCSSV